ncbi:MAG: radical SAM protein [Pseudomonadota bacterium]
MALRIALIAVPLMDLLDGRMVPISMDAVRSCPPYGIYHLATVLKQAGHEVVVIDLIAAGSADLRPYLGLLSASQIVGVGSSSLAWPAARACIAALRAIRPDVPIVLGGIHPTMFDRYALATTAADFVIRGEAEVAFPRLCDALCGRGALRDVPSLTWRPTAGRIARNPAGPLMSAAALAQDPGPDFQGIPAGIYAGVAVESSRGCPFDCAFCSTSYRGTWRALPPAAVVDRIARVVPALDRTTSRFAQVIDDEFTVKPQRVVEICQGLAARRLDLRLIYDARANDLQDEGFIAAVRSHTHQFLVGAECGYDDGLQRVGKGTTVEKLEHAARLLAKHHMAERADFSFMLGLPWEGKAEVMSTVRFAHRLYSTYGVRVLLQWYCQIPGSRLWEEQRRREILHEAQYDEFGFFRDLYLFRCGVALAPSEVLAVHEAVTAMQSLSRRDHAGVQLFQTSTPEPILHYYPPNTGAGDSTALANLRALARAGSAGG